MDPPPPFSMCNASCKHSEIVGRQADRDAIAKEPAEASEYRQAEADRHAFEQADGNAIAKAIQELIKEHAQVQVEADQRASKQADAINLEKTELLDVDMPNDYGRCLDCPRWIPVCKMHLVHCKKCDVVTCYPCSRQRE